MLVMKADVGKDTVISVPVEPSKKAKTVVDSNKNDTLALSGLRARDDASRVILVFILVP